ncbi:MAG: hypothetical protein HC942_08865 [Microcoleus sp. SU_5_6]|nr:hypothetical protein [Microcoleus sp. SU_5_6]
MGEADNSSNFDRVNCQISNVNSSFFLPSRQLSTVNSSFETTVNCQLSTVNSSFYLKSNYALALRYSRNSG